MSLSWRPSSVQEGLNSKHTNCRLCNEWVKATVLGFIYIYIYTYIYIYMYI